MTTTAPYSLPASPQTFGQPVTVEANIQKALTETTGMNAAQKMIWFHDTVKYGINGVRHD